MGQDALPIHRPQDTHRQAALSHRSGAAPLHQKAGCSPRLEQPGSAGVQVDAQQVQGSAALLLTFQRQGHVHQPGRQLCGKPRFQQPGGQLGRQAPIHRGGPAGAHAVAPDHLRCCRAAELLHRIPGHLAPGCHPRCAKHRPQRRGLAEQQGGDAPAGQHLRDIQPAAADLPHLPGQRCQLCL